MIKRFFRWEYLGLVVILLASLVLHLMTMQFHQYIFDEAYYITDALSILKGEGGIIHTSVHPPLGKLLITAGIWGFGNNPFGWRIAALIFGLACIVFVYLICRALKLSNQNSYIATFLFAFESLTFVQSGMAMLDIFLVGFMLASFWFYLRGNYFTSSLLMSLSVLVKLSGLLGVVVICAHWLLTSRRDWRWFILSQLAIPFIFLALLPVLTYVMNGQLRNPISQVLQMMADTADTTFARYSSNPGAAILVRPWDWILHNYSMLYTVLPPQFIGMISPPLWWLIIPSIVYTAWSAVKREAVALFAIFWFAGTYILWIPLNIITDRTTYLYYFLPAIPACCLGLTLILSRLSKFSRWIIPGYLAVYLASFEAFAPLPFIQIVPVIGALAIFSTVYLLGGVGERNSVSHLELAGVGNGDG